MRTFRSAAAGLAVLLWAAQSGRGDPIVFAVSESYRTSAEIRFHGYAGAPGVWRSEGNSPLLASVADPEGLRYYASVYFDAGRVGGRLLTSTTARGTSEGLLYTPDARGEADAMFTLLVGAEPVEAGIATRRDAGIVQWTLQDLSSGTPPLTGSGEWTGSLQAYHTYVFAAHTEQQIRGEVPDTEGNYVAFNVYAAEVIAIPEPGALGLLGLGSMLLLSWRGRVPVPLWRASSA